MSDDRQIESAERTGRARIPLWVKVLVGVSVLLMVVGVALPLVMPVPEPAPAATRTDETAHGLAQGFAASPSNGNGDAAADDSAAEPDGLAAWSPAIFRMGFSFFVGFAIAFALRSFLKLAVVALGFFFLALFGLQYAGLIEVHWSLMEERYHTLTDGLDEKVKAGSSVMFAYLPSAAAATAGLALGFIRRCA